MTTFFDNLIPPPRRIVVQKGTIKPPQRIHPKLAIADRAESEDLQALAALVLQPWCGRGAESAVAVTLALTPGLAQAASKCPASPLGMEYYELTLGRQITLAAPAAAGLRMGLQTLKQILENAQRFGFLPQARIADWPRVAMRGIHVDLAREMEYRPAHLRRVVENLAYLHMNTLHLYLENKFAFPSAPDVAPPNVLTPAQAQALCAYARRFGILIIPQIATMGHMEHFLHGPYAEMREDPKNSFNLCPTHPRTRPFLAGLIADVAAAFQSPYIHVGYDESHSGFCPRCQKHGTPQDLLADHLNWLNQEVKKHGARTMIYGDKFLSREDFPRADAVNGGTSPEAFAALRKVSRDIIITDWHYTAPYGGTTRHLVRQGFEVHIASATNLYWHDSIPLNRAHHWIAETMDRAIQDGATGGFNTNWEYYRGQFLDNFWYFEAVAAERLWTDQPHDFVTWGRRFASRFWDVEEDYYTELAGLAETFFTCRRRAFLDSHVLYVEIPFALNPMWASWHQAAFDFTEAGDYLIAQARAFLGKARRHADTLRLLDMPGQIIRYVGVRAEQRLKLDLALKQGDKEAVLRSLQTLQQAAQQVADRLDAGYRIYGGAVVDRTRIRVHMATLTDCLRLVRRTRPSALQGMTVEDLIQQQQATETDPELFVRSYRAGKLLPRAADIHEAPFPARKVAFATGIPYLPDIHMGDTRAAHGGQDGLLYLQGRIYLPAGGGGELLFGADGPVRVWVNGKACACAPAATNPAHPDEYHGPAVWKKGFNEVIFALHTQKGNAWGVIARCKLAGRGGTG